MKKIALSVIAACVAFALTGCAIRKTQEKCVAIDAHTFETSDGNLFEVKDNLIVGETYIVTFMSADDMTRKDDVITDFIDLEVWELGQDYMN